MARKGEVRRESDTRLALIRCSRRLTQKAVAKAMNCPIATYQRLEEGHVSDPRISLLAAAAIVLDTDIESLIEPKWLQSTGQPATARLVPPKP